MRLKYYIQGILTLLFSLAILWLASGSDLPKTSATSEIVNVEDYISTDISSSDIPEGVLYISGQGWKDDKDLVIYVYDLENSTSDGLKVETIDSNGNWNLKYSFNKQHFGPTITFKVVGQQSGVESSAVFNNGKKSEELESKVSSIFSI